MRSLSLSMRLERCGRCGCSMKSWSLSEGSELCGGVAAPERLESMPLVEARAAAAVDDNSSCGRGELGRFMSMSVSSGGMGSD